MKHGIQQRHSNRNLGTRNYQSTTKRSRTMSHNKSKNINWPKDKRSPEDTWGPWHKLWWPSLSVSYCVALWLLGVCLWCEVAVACCCCLNTVLGHVLCMKTAAACLNHSTELSWSYLQSDFCFKWCENSLFTPKVTNCTRQNLCCFIVCTTNVISVKDTW